MTEQEESGMRAFMAVVPEAKPLAYIGRPVIYHKTVQTATGSKQVQFPALIQGLADKVSGFQEKDQAVTLKIFKTAAQGGDEERQGVMFSHEPMSGRWTINPNIG